MHIVQLLHIDQLLRTVQLLHVDQLLLCCYQLIGIHVVQVDIMRMTGSPGVTITT